MVVQGPLDFNLLLGCEYDYSMGVLVSSLFHVICFPHEDRIVTSDKLPFIGPNLAPGPPSTLTVSYVPVVSSPPQFNYLATYSMSTSTNNLVSELVHNVMGALDPNFQSVVL